MSSLQNKKKTKTGIPVVKITHRNNDENKEGAAAAHTQNFQSETQTESVTSVSVQNLRNQQAQLQHKVNKGHHSQQQLSSYSLISSKPTKKVQGPETWADEVIESHSQKLRINSVSESKRRQEDMEKHLKEAEVQLSTMGSLLEQREKMMKEAAEEADNKTAELEVKLLNQDGHLIKHGIDPVTGERIMPDETGEKIVESSKKATKKRVQEMREKLKEMNNQADSYLTDIENTLQYLNNLEASSVKFGQLSEQGLTQFDEADLHLDEDTLGKNHQTLAASEMTSTATDAPIERDVVMSAGLDAGDGYNSTWLFNGRSQSLVDAGDNEENIIPDEIL